MSTTTFIGSGRLYFRRPAKNCGPRPRRRGQRARARAVKSHRLRIEDTRWPLLGKVGNCSIAPAAPAVLAAPRPVTLSITLEEFNADALRTALTGDAR